LPGGRKIVFGAWWEPGTGKDVVGVSLYVVNADGTGLVRITTASDAADYDVSCSR